MSFEFEDDFNQWVLSMYEQLQQCAQRNYYDGDYFCDIGLEDRMNASWKAQNDAQEVLKAGKKFGFHPWELK